jgi:regulator of cell morphogenesis and NO signaling
MTISEIIRTAPSSKAVFRKYGLDQIQVCQLEFEDACAKCGVNPHLIKAELINIRTAEKQPPESINQVIESILSQHQMVKKIISAIRAVLPLAIVSEKTYRYELLAIKTKFEILQEQLEVHLYKEEMVLFPEFIGLWNKRNGNHYTPPFLLAYPVEGLESEHESAKSILSEISQLTRYYRAPQNTSESYRRVYKHLDALEKKLNDLILVENTLLFPKALAAESDFYNDDSKK